MCETYVKWQEIEPHKQHDIYPEEYIFYAALEWDLYKIFAVVLAGMSTV